MNDWRVQLTTMELEESDIEATLEALRSGWLTMGPRTAELEQAYASAVGSKHAVAVSSGTAALHLACVVAGVGPGDEVIVPALSFVADAHAPRCAGGEPVLVDVVAPGEPLVDPAAVEAAITERTKAVIAVHMFGYPADLDRLAAICDEHGLALIEDCAESDGGRLRDGSPAGTRGVCGCFSFFSKTQLGVGEGGIMTTDDDEFAARLRLLRSHAMTSVTWDRHRGHAETYDVTDLGFNYRIDEPRAALARSRLERLDHSLAELGRVAGEYRERLAAGRRGRDPVRRLRPGLVRALRLPGAGRRPDDPGRAARAHACERRPDHLLSVADPAHPVRREGPGPGGRGVRRSPPGAAVLAGPRQRADRAGRERARRRPAGIGLLQ